MARAPRTDALLVAEIARRALARRAAFLASGAPDSDEAEASWGVVNPDKALGSLRVELDARLKGPRAGLIRTFGLDPAEAALLDLAVAVSVDPALEEEVAALQGLPRRPVPTEALVRRLHGLAPGDIWRPTSPLARWHLLREIDDRSGAAPAFAVDRRIVDWYFGRAALDRGLVGICTLPDGDVPCPGWDVAEEARVVAALAAGARDVRVTVLGPEGSGRRGYLLRMAATLGAQALCIDGGALPRGDMGLAWPLIQRFSILTGRVPLWTSPPPFWPAGEGAPLQLVASVDERPAPSGRFVDHVIQMPAFMPALRQGLWASVAGDTPLPLALSSATPREIADIAPLARRKPELAEALLRQRAISELSSVGAISRPKVRWDDMVLPVDVVAALREYAIEARLRGELLARPEIQRLYARDAAPTALFTGPSGVGKTMAAECIAGELGLPLLVIDVARTVSKYIGDTAKNLSRIFGEARRFGCILFFDEADAYFSKRTDLKDSQDRHANADTNHLLQLIENYEGFVILSTNKRAHIDEAFFRRIRHAVEFHRPDLPERERLWRRFAGLFLSPAELKRLAGPLANCAERFELAPAQIKAAMLSAHYAAARNRAPMDEAHLLTGLARELRKEGRSLPADLADLARRAGEEIADVA